MFDRNTLAQEALHQIELIFNDLKSNASFKNAVIFQPIPRRIDIAKASAAHVPLAKFDSDHAAIQQFQDVAKLFAGLK